jgi:mono/diheme cytochrome c family protein
VAYGQNGEMLRPENGYPLRLVVPGVQGVSWVKWLRRIEVGDKPYATKDEAVHYIDLMPDGLHRQYTSIQECKSVITTPSGGQVLLDKGFYNITGLAWSGRGKVKRSTCPSTAASTGAGAHRRPVHEQVPDPLQHRLGVGRQAGHPAVARHRRNRLRAAQLRPVARRARHQVDLSQQRHPVLESGAKAGRSAMSRFSKSILVLAAIRRRDRNICLRQLQGHRPQATPAEVKAWDIDVRPDFKGLPKGSGNVDRGKELFEEKCASCHGTFGESNEVFTPLIGGTTKDDIKTGRVKGLSSGELPQRTTFTKVATISTLFDYIQRAMPWTAPKSLKPDEVYAILAYLLNLAEIVPADFAVRQEHRRRAETLPNRNGMTTDHGLWPGACGQKGRHRQRRQA